MSQPSNEELKELIALLPQSAVLDPEDVDRWIALTRSIDPERIAWHIARASGIGGSDIGSLVTAMEGKNHRFSPNRLVKQKLLMLPPDVPDVDMKRGLEMEDYVRSRFEHTLNSSQKGFNWTRREDIQETIQSSLNERHPWMRSSLDGVYEIDGVLYLVDFKAPTQDVLESYKRYENFDDYRCQLHHYRLDAQCKGIDIDHMLLIMYDYKSNGVHAFPIDHSPALDARILNAGEYFWHRHVMQGVVPEVTLPYVDIDNEDLPEKISEASRKYIFSKIMSDHLREESSRYREEVETFIRQEGNLGETVLNLSEFMRIKASPDLDCDAAIERLIELGWNEEDLDNLRLPPVYNKTKIEKAYDDMLKTVRAMQSSLAGDRDNFKKACTELFALAENAPIKEKGGWDKDKIIDALVSCNENPEFFLTEKLSSGFPRQRKGYIAESLEELKGMVSDQVDGLVARLSSDMIRESLDHENDRPMLGS